MLTNHSLPTRTRRTTPWKCNIKDMPLWVKTSTRALRRTNLKCSATLSLRKFCEATAIQCPLQRHQVFVCKISSPTPNNAVFGTVACLELLRCVERWLLTCQVVDTVELANISDRAYHIIAEMAKKFPHLKFPISEVLFFCFFTDLHGHSNFRRHFGDFNRHRSRVDWVIKQLGVSSDPSKISNPKGALIGSVASNTILPHWCLKFVARKTQH